MMLRKSEKQAITRIFLWIASGILSLDLFYAGKAVEGVLAVLGGLASLTLIVIGSNEYDAAPLIVVGLALLIFWIIMTVKRLFIYLKMFEKTED